MEAEEVIICRCEDVTLKEILKVIAEGGTTVNEVKRLSRAGMGLCQGKICCRLISQVIAARTGRALARIEPPTSRPPVRPIPIGVIADLTD